MAENTQQQSADVAKHTQLCILIP